MKNNQRELTNWASNICCFVSVKWQWIWQNHENKKDEESTLGIM